MAHLLQPAMKEEEVACYNRWLEQAKCIVEYGSGGSTILALSKRNVRRILSIESDPQWIKQLSHLWRVRWARLTRRLNLHHVDIGPIKGFGYPANDKQKPAWPMYAKAPWTIGAKPDLVLVDGRFRVACAAQVILNAPHAIMVIHDFWKRPQYHHILPFLVIRDRARSLGVFAINTDVDTGLVRDIFDRFMYVPD